MRTGTILIATTEQPDAPPINDGLGRRGSAVASILRRRAEDAGLWIEVSGSSMGSSIPSGAMVLVLTHRRRPRRGEVWAYCLADATVVVHRYRRAAGDRFVFQGDARGIPDGPVERSMLIGRVTRVAIGSSVNELGWRVWIAARIRLDVAAVRRRLGKQAHVRGRS